VIPAKYKRVPCPVVGNMYIWFRPNAGPCYLALTVVNMAGLGTAAKVEAQLPSGDWLLLQRDGNYSLSRPQERFGTWALPQGFVAVDDGQRKDHIALPPDVEDGQPPTCIGIQG
jgi:hypothetical protein